MKEGARVVEKDPRIEVSIAKDKLRIEIPLEAHPGPSRTGNTFVLASTHGVINTGVKYKERDVMLQLQAMVNFEL